MAYGEIKVDTVTFTDGGIDKSVSISGLVQNPTFSGNITVTGTISGNTVQGQTVSGVTVTGTTANFVSGVFTTQISGATITGNVGSFTTITGGTVTLTSGVFASGTAAAPSVSIGTTDNGLYSPGADQVAVATNGTGRLFVDASGNVGVGTSSVNALLEVNNSTAGGEVQRIEGNYSGSGSVILTNWRRAGGSVAAALKYNDDSSPLCMSIGTTTSHEFRIRTADTDAITIDASQRVGIGTSSPGQKLEVQGSAVLFGNGTSDVDVIMGISGYGSRLEYSTGKLFLRTNNSNRLTVDNGGNVGIGTSPDSQLHVVGTGGTGLRIGYTNNTNYFDANTQIFRSNNATTVYGQWDSSGRLLVGTSSSSANARAVIQGRTTNATDQGVLYIQRGSSGPGVVADGSGIGEIWFADSNGYAAANIQCLADNTWGGGGNDYPGRLVFSTTADGASSPTERLRITSAGNVGIGTTAPNDMLTIGTSSAGGNIRLNSSSYGNNGLIDFFGTDGNRKLQISTAASQGTLYTPASTDLAFEVGNTERARIDSSGRLLVGTSTSVAGTIGSSGNWPATGQFNSTSTNNIPLGLFHWSTYAVDLGGAGGGLGNGPDIVLARSNTNTQGSHVAVTNNILLGRVNFSGSDGTQFINGACIAAAVDGTPGTNDMPGRLVFSTTADGASFPTERLRITSAGLVGIGTSAPSAAVHAERSGDLVLLLNRTASDGEVARFSVGGTTAFSFSTSGTARTIDSPSAVNLNFKVNGSDRVSIDSSGRVGIGTTSPSSKLSISTAANSPALDITDASTSDFIITPGVSSGVCRVGPATGAMALYTGNTERVRLDASGRLLVGTSSTSAACTQLLQGSSGGLAPAIQVLSSTASAPANGSALAQITFTR
jgi:hypothetical protein